jgi:hypothetical protein
MGASPIAATGPYAYGYTEHYTSGDESYDQEAGKVEFVRVFQGPWEHRQSFLFDHIFPRTETAEGQVFTRVPDVYPAYRSARPYKATVKGGLATDKETISGDPFIKHTIATITVNYKVPENSNPGGGDLDVLYVEESCETETEILPLPARKFEYTIIYNGQYEIDYQTYLVERQIQHPSAFTFKRKRATEDGKINHLIKRINYKLKVPFLIAPRWGYISAMLGSVNYAPFITVSNLFVAPGQFRFDGITSVTKRELTSQVLGWEFEFAFSFYKPGWNTKPTVMPISDELSQSGLSDGILTKEDVTLTLAEIEAEDTKVRHASIIPPLYPYKFHQLIFAPIPVADLLAWYRWFFSRPYELVRKFYDPDDPVDLTPEEMQALISDPISKPLWVA